MGSPSKWWSCHLTNGRCDKSIPPGAITKRPCLCLLPPCLQSMGPCRAGYKVLILTGGQGGGGPSHPLISGYLGSHTELPVATWSHPWRDKTGEGKMLQTTLVPLLTISHSFHHWHMWNVCFTVFLTSWESVMSQWTHVQLQGIPLFKNVNVLLGLYLGAPHLQR